MDNNDKFRRIRYIFKVNDTKLKEIFHNANQPVTSGIINGWLLKDEDDPEYLKITDLNLAIFLNGLIIEKRGKREGPQPVPERRLNNNVILKKLKIALNLQSDDILNIFQTTDKKISAHELSALFRNPNQSQYRACNDQFLRNFLNGLQNKYRKSE
jgi:uncharacterized protein YehS (DUF1456 family)